MRPSKLFFEFVDFFSLISSFLCFCISRDRFTKRTAKIRKSLAFASQYLRGLTNIFETDIIFLRKLGKLGAFEEELGVMLGRKQAESTKQTLYLSDG